MYVYVCVCCLQRCRLLPIPPFRRWVRSRLKAEAEAEVAEVAEVAGAAEEEEEEAEAEAEVEAAEVEEGEAVERQLLPGAVAAVPSVPLTVATMPGPSCLTFLKTTTALLVGNAAVDVEAVGAVVDAAAWTETAIEAVAVAVAVAVDRAADRAADRAVDRAAAVDKTANNTVTVAGVR